MQPWNAKFYEYDLTTKTKIIQVAAMIVGTHGECLRDARGMATHKYEHFRDEFNENLRAAEPAIAGFMRNIATWPAKKKMLIHRITPQMGVENHALGFVMAATIFERNRENFVELLRDAPSTNPNELLLPDTPTLCMEETTEKCGLCEKTHTARLNCCRQTLCHSCLFNVCEVCDCMEPKLFIKCPFCRDEKVKLDDFTARLLMSEQCPSHAKVMKNTCNGRSMVVYHVGCDAEGCYDCQHSKLRAVTA